MLTSFGLDFDSCFHYLSVEVIDFNISLICDGKINRSSDFFTNKKKTSAAKTGSGSTKMKSHHHVVFVPFLSVIRSYKIQILRKTLNCLDSVLSKRSSAPSS